MPLFGTDGEPLTGKAMFERLGSGSDARFKITIEIPNDPELRKDFSDPLLNPMSDDFSSISDDAGRIFGEVIGNFATSSEPIFRSDPLNLLVFESPPDPEPADPDLFTDGFESGSTSAWTSDLDDGFNAGGFFPDATDPGNGTSESPALIGARRRSTEPRHPHRRCDRLHRRPVRRHLRLGRRNAVLPLVPYRSAGGPQLAARTPPRPSRLHQHHPIPKARSGHKVPRSRRLATFPSSPAFNFEIWTGPDLTPIADAIAGLGDALVAVFMWDAETQSYQAFRTAGPAFTNNLEELVFRAGRLAPPQRRRRLAAACP